MAASDPANNPSPSDHVPWQGLAFACLGMIAGAGYGYGISVATASGLLTTWILVLIGSVVLGLFGYRFSDIPDYTTIQKVAAIPLVPVVFVASSVGMLVAIVLIGALSPVFVIQNVVRDRKFRARMRAASRFITWQDLFPKLEAGNGTLLVESHGTGPFRIWYTPDNVLAKGDPISTNEELLGVLGGKVSHVFNSRCLQEYLDSDRGAALLTSIRPTRLRAERLQKQCPKATIVRLYHRRGQMTSGSD